MKQEQQEKRAFNDDYELDDQYQKLRKMLKDMEYDFYEFLGPTMNKSAATRVRNKLREIRDASVKFYHDIAKQRQDNDSHY